MSRPLVLEPVVWWQRYSERCARPISEQEFAWRLALLSERIAAAFRAASVTTAQAIAAMVRFVEAWKVARDPDHWRVPSPSSEKAR